MSDLSTQDQQPTADASQLDAAGSSITARSLIVGSVLCAFISVTFPYNCNVTQSSYLALDHTSVGAMAVFFLVVVTNLLARVIERRFAGRSMSVGLAVLVSALVLTGLIRWVGVDCRYSRPGLHALTQIIAAFGFLLVGTFALLAISGLLERTWSRTGVGRLSLGRGELLTTCAMLLIASSITTMGLGQQLPTMLASPIHYATPQNRWDELCRPHLPDWAIVTDERAAKAFYNGLPTVDRRINYPSWARVEPIKTVYQITHYMRRIPWGAWAKPLALWGAFLLALYWFMVCAMVIIRRQWMDREILVYPMMRLPLEMTRDEPDHLAGPLWRSYAMWIGAAIPLAFTTAHGLHEYFPAFPGDQIAAVLVQYIYGDYLTVSIRLSFVALGFAYLINTRISFSLTFFTWVGMGVTLWLTYTGTRSPENLGGHFGGGGNPFMYHFGIGAILMLGALGLWAGRRHLAAVLRKAVTGDPTIDDGDEIISYRAAVIGMAATSVFILVWLRLCNIPWPATLVFFLVAMCIFYTLTRIVMEGGISAVVAAGITPVVVTSKMGFGMLGAGGMTGMALMYIWCSDIRTFVMAGAAHGLRLAGDVTTHRRRLTIGILLAVVITTSLSVIVVIYISHVHVGINMNPWFFVSAPQAGLTYAIEIIQQKPPPNRHGWIASLWGAAIMAGVIFLNSRLLRWPFHPLGLAVMGNWLMNSLWFSVGLACLIKWLVLKFGGPRIYQKTVPFFLGLILGQCIAAGIWALIDLALGTRVSVYHFWI